LPSIVEMLACADDIPTLENFAYGDTPTERSVTELVNELLSAGPEFDVSLFDLSNRLDIRQLVLRTALTYLELRGVLRQGTPFYAGYEFRPLSPIADIAGQFNGEPAKLVHDVFNVARFGRKWYALNPEEAANALGQERRRIVRCLEVLEERGLIELKLADARQRYTRLRDDVPVDVLAGELVDRFHRREQQEVTRIQQIVSLVTHDGCQTNALVSHFGENRAAPCGHCAYCETGEALILPDPQETRPISSAIAPRTVQMLMAKHPSALGDPRQAARFLCGLTSPALMRDKLTRHDLFGALTEWRFAEVLAWCEEME
jgi:ATP-dependent DNA helicase RecQ